MPAPWECPRRHKMNAPHVDQCPCPATTAPFVQPMPITVPVFPQPPFTPGITGPWAPPEPFKITYGQTTGETPKPWATWSLDEQAKSVSGQSLSNGLTGAGWGTM